MHIVPMDDSVHPVFSKPSILFIRNIKTGKTYYFAWDHPDSIHHIPVLRFVEEYLKPHTGRKWVLDKKAFEQMVGGLGVYDANLVCHFLRNETFAIQEYETPTHFLIRKNAVGHPRLNMVIPLMKHLETFDELADDLTALLEGYEPDDGFIRFNELIIDPLRRLEQGGIFVDRERFKARYNIDPGLAGIVHSQYNVYTSTGRPSNRFGGVNYAALNATDGTRKCFRSRWGKDGCMVVLDYTAFHPRIIAHLTKYSLSTDTDIYEYLAKLYFHKKTVDETDIKEAKVLTFRQVYGGVEDKYAHIKYLGNLKAYIDSLWEQFTTTGHVTTPFFKRQITSRHVSEPNPPKVFNYILQATEGELSIPKVKTVLEYLRGFKTAAVLYTYDSVMYDFFKPDGLEVLRQVRDIMSFDGKFPMKAYMGETYDDVKLFAL